MAESTARLDKNNLLIKFVPYAAYYEVQHGGCQPEPDVIMAMGGCHGFIFVRDASITTVRIFFQRFFK